MKKIGMIVGALLLCNVALGEGFSDTSGHWAEKYINEATEKGYFSGYPDGTFLPQKNISRIEFVTVCSKFVNKNSDVKEVNTDKVYMYSDIKDASWAEPIYKEFMTKVNIFESESNEKYGEKEIKQIFGENFEPNKPITREEAVAIFNIFIANEYKKEGDSKFSDTNVATFPNSIKTATDLGIVSGYTDGTYKPFGLVTRAEASTMLLNFENNKQAVKNITFVEEDKIEKIYNEYKNPEEVVKSILEYEMNNEFYKSYQLHDETCADFFGYKSYLTYMKDTAAHTYNEKLDLEKMKYEVKNISDNIVKVSFSDGDNFGEKTLYNNDGKWYAYFGVIN